MHFSKLVRTLLIFITYNLMAQPIQEIHEVKVVMNPPQKNDPHSIDSAKMNQWNAFDVGEQVSKLPGVSVKSYGGVNGMKTLTVRGIGGQHSSIIVDGFPQVNTANQLIDLSHYPLDFLSSLELSFPLSNRNLIPISAFHSANLLRINTFTNDFHPSAYRIRLQSKIGSYGFQDYSLAAQFNPKKWFIGVAGKFRDYQGNYPYEYQNYQTEIKGKRSNNDLRHYQIKLNSGYQIDSLRLVRISYQYQKVDQGLPGALILYANSGVQRLTNESHQATLEYQKKGEKLQYRMYSQISPGLLIYRDDQFLNAAGFMENKYLNLNLQNGISAQWKLLKHWQLFGGYEFQYHQLQSEQINLQEIHRKNHLSSLGTQFTWSQTTLSALLNYQQATDRSPNSSYASELDQFSYAFGYKQFLFKGNSEIQLWYRKSYRLPSFNELYFQNIGNNQLQPEQANQLALSLAHLWIVKKSRTTLQGNAYVNEVKHKIVAIPSKNLFIWSMMNVNLVKMLGIDISIQHEWQLTKNWRISAQVSYTFQKIQDFSDKNSSTYRHQIAYAPEHLYQGMLQIHWKKINFTYGLYGQSKQYALNQNIPSNEVEGYWIQDLGLGYRLPLKNQSILIQGTIKNLGNQNYMNVRNYYMPKRNFTLTLSYALH